MGRIMHIVLRLISAEKALGWQHHGGGQLDIKIWFEDVN